jgi:glycosyltransferase involved in cell wall biosynthesis
MHKICIIVPLYNEENVFGHLMERLSSVVGSAPYQIEVILVDDGSSDATSDLMRDYSMRNTWCTSIVLSRNFGHQIAVSAGVYNISDDCTAVMIIDGDLQDPPELYAEFYEKIREGYDVVYAVRKKRKEGFFKKTAYWAFYRFLNFISTYEIPLDSGDFCMISRRVAHRLNEMPERSRFLRGMRSWVGYRQIGIQYERDPRFAGKEKYNFRMLFRLAYDGIFNFSDVPLKFITRLGLFVMVPSILYITLTLFKKLMGYDIPQGFTAVIVAISLFSSVQLISLGVMGEYLIRIFNQVKERPLFIVKSKIRNGSFEEVQ